MGILGSSYRAMNHREALLFYSIEKRLCVSKVVIGKEYHVCNLADGFAAVGAKRPRQQSPLR
jgi:hypothetical protein